MIERVALRRLRVFLHLFAAGLFVGTIAELLSAKHYADPVQLVPFALCGLGLLALAAVWVSPERRVLWGVGLLMGVIASGSLLGIYEHIQGNIDLVHEIHRNPTNRQLIDAVLTGRNPLLAPGTLAVAAGIAIAGLYATSKLALSAARESVDAVETEPEQARRWFASARRSSRAME